MIKCDVCGIANEETRIIKSNDKYYCRKHYLQIYKYGNTFRSVLEPNEYIIEGNICYICLYDKNGIEKCKAIIDSKHIQECKEIKWYGRKNGNTTYCYGSIKGNPNKKILLHRFILDYTGDNPIDHINHNGLDNRECNLRICEHKENIRNMKKNKIIGVNYSKKNKKYKASIMVDYQQITLGYFIDIEDAIKARREAEIKYFGEFAPCLSKERNV